MKFEEAYCVETTKTHTLGYLVASLNDDPMTFAQLYKDKLLCPECCQAPLSLNNDQPPYLSAYPKARHAIDCSLKQDTMSVAQSDKYVSDAQNRAQILRQIHSVMIRQLSVSDVASVKSPGKSKVIANQGKPPVLISEDVKTKRLCQKRIDTDFGEEDFNCYKLFYGKVFINWEKDDTDDAYRILMYHPVKRYLICRLKVTELAYKYVDEACKLDTMMLGNVVFLALFAKPTGKRYQRTSLERGEYFAFIAS